MGLRLGLSFPKSLDVSKAIDRRREDDVRHVCRFLAAHLGDWTISSIVRAFGFAGTGDHGVSAWFREDHVSPRVPTLEQWVELKRLLGFASDMDGEITRLNMRKGRPGDAWASRMVVGSRVHARSGGEDFAKVPGSRAVSREEDLTLAATEQAEAWLGWGTALKPAHEPIIVARKPLAGTIAANVLTHGTGALNIDACRIGTTKCVPGSVSQRPNAAVYGTYRGETGTEGGHDPNLGRWPANVVLSHSEDCVEIGTRRVKPIGATARTAEHGKGRILNNGGKGKAHPGFRDSDGTEAVPLWACVPGCAVRALDGQSGDRSSPWIGNSGHGAKGGQMFGGNEQKIEVKPEYRDSGGASRFFYCAKASRAERNAGLAARTGEGRAGMNEGLCTRECNACGSRGKKHGEPWPTCGHDDWAWRDPAGSATADVRNNHPTVKPLDLMRWLVRLVCPPGGLILDPFAGSGTTGCAAALEGFRCVGIERDESYAEIARARIAYWMRKPAGMSTTQILAADRTYGRDASQLSFLDSDGGA